MEQQIPVETSIPTEPVTPTITPPSVPMPDIYGTKKAFPWLPVLFSILFLLTFAAGTFFFFRAQSLQKQLIPTKASPTAITIDKSKSSQDLDSWFTFTGKEISFKYPRDYAWVKADNGVVLFFSSEDGKWQCHQYKDQCLKSSFQLSGISKFSQAKHARTSPPPSINFKLFLDSQSRQWETDMVLGEVYNYTASTTDGSDVYTISFQSGYTPTGISESDYMNIMRSLFEQMISTIQIIESSDVVEGWQLYTNHKLGLMFSYPYSYGVPEETTRGISYTTSCGSRIDLYQIKSEKTTLQYLKDDYFKFDQEKWDVYTNSNPYYKEEISIGDGEAVDIGPQGISETNNYFIKPVTDIIINITRSETPPGQMGQIEPKDDPCYAKVDTEAKIIDKILSTFRFTK